MRRARPPRRTRTATDKAVFTLIQEKPGLTSREIGEQLGFATKTITISVGKWWSEKAISRYWSEADKVYRYYPAEHVGKEKMSRIKAQKMREYMDYVERKDDSDPEGWVPKFVRDGMYLPSTFRMIRYYSDKLTNGELVSVEELEKLKTDLQALSKSMTNAVKLIDSIVNREELWDPATLPVWLKDNEDNYGGED